MSNSNHAHRYHAFISYNHNPIDKNAASAVQLMIERFGKKWYEWKAASVFRDTTDLSLTPELWGEIKRRIDDSKYFLLIASPGAVQSKWVYAELGYWLTGLDFKSDEHGQAKRPLDRSRLLPERAERLCIVLTAADWTWLEENETNEDGRKDGDGGKKDDTGDEEKTGEQERRRLFRDLLTVAASANHLVGELGGLVRKRATLDPSNREFIEKIGPVVARVRDVAEVGVLVREDYREHRKSLMIFRGLAIGLFLFLVSALFAAWYASVQSERARSNLARIALANGRRAVEQRDASQAVHWYLAAAEQIPRRDPLYDSAHRLTNYWLEQAGQAIVHDAPISASAVSTDGRLVATGDEQGLARLWQVDRFAPLGGPCEGRNRVTAVAIHPDGQSWIACRDRIDASGVIGSIIDSYDLSGRRRGEPVEIDGEGLDEVRFSPRGRWLLLRDAGKLHTVVDARTWTVAPIRLADRDTGESDAIVFVGFTSDDAHVVVCRTKSLDVIPAADDMAKSDPFSTRKLRAKAIWGTVSRNDNIVLLMDDGVCEIVDRKQETPVATFRWREMARERDYEVAPVGPVEQCKFASNGDLLAIGDRKDVRIWDISHLPTRSNGMLVSEIRNSPGVQAPEHLVMAPDGGVIAVVGGKDCLVYETNMGTLLAELPDASGERISTGMGTTGDNAYSHTATLLTHAAGRLGVRLWRLPLASSNAEPEEQMASRNGVTAVCLSSCERRVVTANYDGSIQIRDARSLKTVLELPTRQGRVPQTLTRSPDDKILYVTWKGVSKGTLDESNGATDEIVAYQYARGLPMFSWSELSDVEARLLRSCDQEPVIAVTTGGGLLVCDNGRSMVRFDVVESASRRVDFSVSRLSVPGNVSGLAANPVANQIAAITRGSLATYDLDTGRRGAKQKCDFKSLAYTADGREIVLFGLTRDNGIVRRLDSQTLQPLGDDMHWRAQILAIAVNRSADVLITGGRHGELVIWDFPTGHQLRSSLFQVTRYSVSTDDPRGEGLWSPSAIKTVAINRAADRAFVGTTRDARYVSAEAPPEAIRREAQRELRKWQIGTLPIPGNRLRESVEFRTGGQLELPTGQIKPLTHTEWLKRFHVADAR